VFGGRTGARSAWSVRSHQARSHMARPSRTAAPRALALTRRNHRAWSDFGSMRERIAESGAGRVVAAMRPANGQIAIFCAVWPGASLAGL